LTPALLEKWEIKYQKRQLKTKLRENGINPKEGSKFGDIKNEGNEVEEQS